MARAYTPAELLARLRQITDTENDTHISDTEGYAILSSALASWRDFMITKGLGEHFVKNTTFNTVDGQLEYDLTSGSIVTDQDFYKIRQLYTDEGSGQFRPIQRISDAEVQAFRPVRGVVPMKLYYVPHAPKITGASTPSTIEFFDGWEEYVLQLAAITVKVKKQESAEPHRQAARDLERRLATAADTGFDEPPRVVRRRQSRYRDPFLIYRNNVNAYNIRGSKLELYYHYGYQY